MDTKEKVALQRYDFVRRVHDETLDFLGSSQAADHLGTRALQLLACAETLLPMLPSIDDETGEHYLYEYGYKKKEIIPLIATVHGERIGSDMLAPTPLQWHNAQLLCDTTTDSRVREAATTYDKHFSADFNLTVSDTTYAQVVSPMINTRLVTAEGVTVQEYAHVYRPTVMLNYDFRSQPMGQHVLTMVHELNHAKYYIDNPIRIASHEDYILRTELEAYAVQARLPDNMREGTAPSDRNLLDMVEAIREEFNGESIDSDRAFTPSAQIKQALKDDGLEYIYK